MPVTLADMGTDKQETQPTQPAEGEPVEIPVPERDDVMRDLRKMTKPPAPGPPPKKRWGQQ